MGGVLAATPPGLGMAGPAQTIKIAASDGLQLVALYYPSPLSGRQAPAALLLHQYGGNKEQWTALAQALNATGYAVLAVDQRGFGATGGKEDWKAAEADIATMLAWLRKDPSIAGDQIALIGASIGSNLALRGCATDAKCHAVVALSPGLNYFGVTTADTLTAMKGKGVLLIAGQLDSLSADSVKKLAFSEPGNVMLRLYDSSAHGKDLFQYDDVIPTILQWLKTYNRLPTA